MEANIKLLKEKIEELEKENSELRKKGIEITEAKELYLKIFEEFPALIWRSRLDKLCDYFNKTWLEFTGRTKEQEFGNGWAEGVHPDDFDFCLQTYVTAFDKREPFLMEYRMKNKLGEYRWIRDFGRPFYDLDNSFLGYIGSCYDITEIKNNELRLEELNTTKDKFLSIIAHDLKDPFNSIMGFSDLLVEQVNAKNYDNIDLFAKKILQSSGTALNLLANLMEWSRMESGRMNFMPVYFDIVILINEVIRLLEGTAEQKSISIENSLPKSITVYADKEMVSAVLRNLISNALKFSKVGGNITVFSKTVNDEVVISIKDNGVGIDSVRQSKLFTYSASGSTPGTMNEKGTGLGLVLCKEFIEKNGGKIWVESQVGSGSTFNFSLKQKKL